MYLSKSLYTRGLQCVKSLWLKKYNQDVLTIPNEQTQAIFKTGNDVEELACKLFPNGKEVPFKLGLEDMIIQTKLWINMNMKNIYEASFKYNGIFIAVDILHVIDNAKKEVKIYEVKSSTSVKDIYLHDASIQYYVLSKLGYDVKEVNIIHINSKYVREKELDITKLFSVVDVTDEVKKLKENIPNHLNHFRRYLNDKENEPNIDIGTHCSNPYACDAIDYCWKYIPEYSIFDISRLKTNKKFELYNQNVITFKDITDITNFTTTQQIQIESELSQEEIINSDNIKDFLDTLTYPIYHLDFETFQQAIPEFEGISPFQQIPFQYSLHIQEEDGSLKHKEFLAKDGFDPRYELAKRLVEDIPTNVTVLAYNMSFEKGVIRKLANLYSEFTYDLMSIHDNIKDLMIPFQNKDYYSPKMKGSYSIKNVLPALVPQMEKAYKDLNLIHNGGEAMQAYANLSKIENEEQKEEYREALLEYCKLDTLAMVKIIEKLKENIK